MKQLLRLYDFLSSHRRWLWLGLVVVLSLLVGLAFSLRYREDISDFLPVDNEYRESMQVYQQLSEASRIVVIFEGVSADSLCDAIDYFALLAENDSSDIVQADYLRTEVDINSYLERLRFVHANAPYFISTDDYLRLDTLFSPDGIAAALAHDRLMLSMPLSGMLQNTVSSDPLSIFPLSAGANTQYAGAASAFSAYDGYMLTADHRMAFAFYDSPFGSTESSRNAVLCEELEKLSAQVMAQYPHLSVRLIGAPVVSVENAKRIKLDSVIAILLSVLLIAALLLYSFPRKRDILLIALSVGFGWLFGMAMLRLFAGCVSVIVLGIGSILIGIAVNYPLHILVHQRYCTSVRQTLEEVLSPLLVGNITTVGAFLALIPLNATALRHLGIFASSMLLGTILFCVVVLPHLMKAESTAVRELHLLPKRWQGSDLFYRHPVWSALFLVLLTIALYLPLAFHSGGYQLFDSNLSHINYMTPEQRSDFAFFEKMSPVSDEKAYLVSSAKEELSNRLIAWQEFWTNHDKEEVINHMRLEAARQGFSENAFLPFEQMLLTDFSLPQQQTFIDEHLPDLWPGRFDVEKMNATVTTALSDNFNYLGICCSLIVFLFLCLSFKSILLALVAFLPMAFSWVWIYALMQLLGIQFNIVNIILATFIFGQGDDYTIFILEGLIYEQKTGQKMLPQYKQSIILSALIMLVGIGVLIVARHPAMHSLGTVTLIGMSCVVVMAYLVPPILLSLLLKIPAIKRRLLKL